MSNNFQNFISFSRWLWLVKIAHVVIYSLLQEDHLHWSQSLKRNQPELVHHLPQNQHQH